ncbi:hypothetical protein [Nocardiopsis listeri]|uniref:hypothetical protein n=1 Tax=Nocardiopsis listeri TaxID=53440 RepID=UPI00082BFAEC|nr:hypothetical protein [Nocardiopsis listeri]
MTSTKTRVGTAAAALAVAVGGSIAVAPAAGAEEATTASVVYSCTEPPYPPGDSSWTLRVSAPVHVRSGEEIPLEATLTPENETPVEMPAEGISGSVDLAVSGSVEGSVTAEGLTNTDAVPVGEVPVLTGGHGSFPATDQGIYLFTPTGFTLHTWMGTELDCSPKDSAPIVAVTVVAG